MLSTQNLAQEDKIKLIAKDMKHFIRMIETFRAEIV